MNCSEVRELAPLYLSNELDSGSRRSLVLHLVECRVCAEELADAAALDGRLRESMRADIPEASEVEGRVRAEIAAGRRRNTIRRYAMAAAVVLAAGIGIALWRERPLPEAYAATLRDHRAEVVRHQPRRWRSGVEEVNQLAGRFDLSASQLTTLSPAGYHLEHAKICGVAGESVLHLVYSDGARETSIFIHHDHDAAIWGARRAANAGDYVDAVRRDGYTAVIVTQGSRADCLPFERSAARAL